MIERCARLFRSDVSHFVFRAGEIKNWNSDASKRQILVSLLRPAAAHRDSRFHSRIRKLMCAIQSVMLTHDRLRGDRAEGMSRHPDSRQIQMPRKNFMPRAVQLSRIQLPNLIDYEM